MAGRARTSRPWPRTVALTLLCLAAAGAFWAGVWHQTAESALTRVPQLDEAWYLRDGQRLREEGLPGREPFVMSPGYSVLVSLAAPVAPDEHGRLLRHPRALLAGQALAWLGTGLLVGLVVHRTGRRGGAGRREAWAAALAAALLFLLYRPAAIYARTILLDIWLTLLVTAALAAATAARRPVTGAVIAAGLALGLAALLRAHVLVLLPLFATLVWRGAAGRRRPALLATLLVLALLPSGLASWHNTRASGRLAGPSLNVGLNLYLGLLPAGQGLFTAIAGLDHEGQPSGEAYLAGRLGRPLDGPAAADAAWRQEAWRLVAAAPGRAALGWLRKVWLHLQAWEIAQVTPLGAWPREAPLLRALVVPWALLVVAGLVGAAAVLASPGAYGGARPAAGMRRTVMVWLLAAALLVAAQSVFFVVSRYRLPLAPMLAVLAGCGLPALRRLGREGRRRLAWPALILALATAATVPWGLARLRAEWSGLESLNHARRLTVLAAAAGPGAAGEELRERAEGLLEHASAASARRQEVWALRAANLAAAGRRERAVDVLSRGIMQVDQPRGLQALQLAILRDLGRLDAVEAMLIVYLGERPDDGDLWHDLIVLLGRQGRWQEAAVRAQAFQSALPDDHRGWLDLGIALARLGRRQAAAEVFSEGLRRFDDESVRALFVANLAHLEAEVR